MTIGNLLPRSSHHKTQGSSAHCKKRANRLAFAIMVGGASLAGIVNGPNEVSAAPTSTITTKTTMKSSSSKTTTTSKTTATSKSTTKTTTKSTSSTKSTKGKSPTSSSVVPSVKGPVFIPGAGKVLDLGLGEVMKLAAGGKVEADVRGATGLAASGTGTVILDVTITQPTTSGQVTLTPVAPEFARTAVTSAVSFQSGPTTVTRVAVPVGSAGLVRVNTATGPTGLSISVVGWVVSAYSAANEPSGVALTSCRLLDTTTGQGGLSGEISAARPFDLPAVGVGNVPTASNATGSTPTNVILSVTGSQASGELELRIIPTGGDSPETKILLGKNQTTTANYVVPVYNDARVAFYVSSAGTQIQVDVVGWLDRDNLAHSGGPCSN